MFHSAHSSCPDIYLSLFYCMDIIFSVHKLIGCQLIWGIISSRTNVTSKNWVRRLKDVKVIGFNCTLEIPILLCFKVVKCFCLDCIFVVLCWILFLFFITNHYQGLLPAAIVSSPITPSASVLGIVLKTHIYLLQFRLSLSIVTIYLVEHVAVM